jgi:hypothetical protein
MAAFDATTEKASKHSTIADHGTLHQSLRDRLSAVSAILTTLSGKNYIS